MKIRLRGIAASASLALVAAMTACSPSSDADDSGIVASMYPAAYLAERITGESVSVLTAAGSDPHDLELTPRQIGRLQDVDLLITIGGVQPAVDDVVAELDASRVLDLMEVLEDDLIESDHDHEHGHDDDHAHEEDDHGHDDHGHDHDHDHAHEGDHDHAHDDDHAHEDGDRDNGHDDHDHGPHDPHFWTDPVLMEQAAEAIADRLIDLDPDNADTLRANADALIDDLVNLHQSFAEGLENCEHRTFVTSHRAFGYLADRYDLEEIAIAGIDTADEPSPAAMARIVDEIRDSGVTTVFTERIAGIDSAGTVANEAGVEVAILDPVEGLTDETADEDYLSLMEQNLEALRLANHCS